MIATVVPVIAASVDCLLTTCRLRSTDLLVNVLATHDTTREVFLSFLFIHEGRVPSIPMHQELP